MTDPPGGTIAQVRPDSLAAKAGLQVGEVLLSVNGHGLRDVIDYRFYSADEALDIAARSLSGAIRTLRINRGYGQEIGVEFTTPTFDGLGRCQNKCDFCFVRQMPPGLRASLYVKDDDYRHSFLFGNFVTLTNLTDVDWQRLAEQRLSPLYVSVHSTNPALRRRLFGVPGAGEIVEQIERLGSMGIQVHAQVVLIPGVNDGKGLEQTVEDLARLFPTVASVALVPVGLTRYHACGLRLITADEAEAVLQAAQRWQRQFRESWGAGFVYPSDELYLLAGAPVPAAPCYDGFPHLANGVGLVRQLLDDGQRTLARPAMSSAQLRAVTLVCGTLIAPTMQRLVSSLGERLSSEIRLLPVANRFFGTSVTVSGLLTGQDVLAALRGRDLGDRVILPRAMFDASGRLALDDRSTLDIASELGVDVGTADRLSGIVPQLQA